VESFRFCGPPLAELGVVGGPEFCGLTPAEPDVGDSPGFCGLPLAEPGVVEGPEFCGLAPNGVESPVLGVPEVAEPGVGGVPGFCCPTEAGPDTVEFPGICVPGGVKFPRNWELVFVVGSPGF